MSITWYEDNSMEIEQTVDGSGTAATVTAYITPTTPAFEVELEPTGTADHYAATVHPAALDLVAGTTYRLRIEATYGGATLESEESFKPRVRRTS